MADEDAVADAGEVAVVVAGVPDLRVSTRPTVAKVKEEAVVEDEVVVEEEKARAEEKAHPGGEATVIGTLTGTPNETKRGCVSTACKFVNNLNGISFYPFLVFNDFTMIRFTR